MSTAGDILGCMSRLEGGKTTMRILSIGVGFLRCVAVVPLIAAWTTALVGNSLAQTDALTDHARKMARYCRLAHGKIVNGNCDDGFPYNGKSTWNPQAFKAVFGVYPPRDTWAVNEEAKRAARAKGQLTATTPSKKAEKPKRLVPEQQKATASPPPVAVSPTVVSPPITMPINVGTRVALVIGNSAYKNVATLPNPRRDAAMIAATLQRIGFLTVTLESDLSREKLMDALRAFSRQAEKADWAIVYFAGHGIEIGGVNYLIPVDAKLETDREVQFETIPLDHVLAAVEPAKKLRIVLLDACRNNPFVQGMRRSVAARSIGRGLASIEPEAGTLVVYAAKHREIALDGDGTNSPFVAALVKYLEAPGIEVRRLFDFVRDDVLASTRRRQQPYTYGSLPANEDFFFVAAK